MTDKQSREKVWLILTGSINIIVRFPPSLSASLTQAYLAPVMYGTYNPRARADTADKNAKKKLQQDDAK